METLEQFVKRISEHVGCYYKKNKRVYSLKKYQSASPGSMGVFGWIGERKTIDLFRVSTYKYLADELGIREADEEKKGAHYVPKDRDEGQGTGLVYYIRRGSGQNDFQKAVRALTVILRNR